jgi:hypothetical protein
MALKATGPQESKMMANVRWHTGSWNWRGRRADRLIACVLAVSLVGSFGLSVQAQSSVKAGDADRLVAAMLGDTPLEEDLQALLDEIGGRPTGSKANLAAVEWASERFRAARVTTRKEAFPMPGLWLERSTSAEIRGDGIRFTPAVAAIVYSPPTPPGGISAPLVDAGRGSQEELEALGENADGAFVLVETEELTDVPGLFKEYVDAAGIEKRAFAAGVKGVIYMGSRPRSTLYRQFALLGYDNTHPMLIMGRADAGRALRLLRAGHDLDIHVSLDIETGPGYDSYNVIGEIAGTAPREEFVLIGAHIDSWGLGTGALDNGCNAAMVIDIARQMKRLGIRPRRTIRFALFNGEEFGLYGSWGYTVTHANELDRHVMASSYDIGSGRINGFITGGRPEIVAAVEKALKPVEGLGPFTHNDIPIVGTDNFDFLIHGIGNLVADQDSANYGPNYHAASDTFDKVDLHQLRLNGAIAAAVTLGFASMDVDWERWTRAQIQEQIDSTALGEQMEIFGMLDDWERKERGRTD